MPGTSSINGVVSGLDTDTIISKIMEVAKQPLTNLTNKQADYTQQLTAWQEFNTRLLALQTTGTALSNATTFASNAVTSSNQDLLTGTADATAATGTYYIKVTGKAQTQQLASQGFANVTDAVGKGKVHFAIADGTTFDVTIDDSNNSLIGLRDAINKAGKGVGAVIVNTGDADAPYQLLVTTKGSGTKNAMTITSDSTDPGPIAINQVVQAADDAKLTLGSGAGAINIVKSTNTITDVIPGVTLNVRDFDPDQTVTFQVGTDINAIDKKINDFVTQYNNVIDFVNSQFNFDIESNKQGVLFGDYQLQIIQSDLTSAIMNPAAGISQELKVLSQVGITVDTDGKLSVDTSKLNDALTNNLSQVNSLFSTGYDSTDPNITYRMATADTQASTLAGYQVSVTAAALRARVTAGVAQAGTLGQDESLTLNGSTILLTAGMTQTEVIAKINESAKYTGVTALATGADGTGTGNYLTLRQATYGASLHVTAQSSVSSGAGVTSGLGNVEVTEAAGAGESGVGTATAGQDMVGTINGVAAKANGQLLTAQAGADGKNTAQGLTLRIDSLVPTTATIHFTKGVGTIVKDLVTKATAKYGGVTTAENTINKQIDDIKSQITDMNERLNDRQARLYEQFNAMEDALAKLQSQGTAISSLLSTFNSSSTSSKSK